MMETCLELESCLGTAFVADSISVQFSSDLSYYLSRGLQL